MKKPKISVALLGTFLLSWRILGTAAAQTDPLSVWSGHCPGDRFERDILPVKTRSKSHDICSLLAMLRRG